MCFKNGNLKIHMLFPKTNLATCRFKKHNMRQLILFFLLFSFISVHGHIPNATSQCELKKHNVSKQTNINYIYKIIPSINSTWGYDIYKGEKKFIHQTNIPGMPGNNGFKTKSDAKKIARLVIDKLKNGEMPPSVTIDEMKKLNVLLTN
jgi:hypothetical protein